MYCFLPLFRRLGRLGLLAGLLAGADFSATLLARAPGVFVQSAVAQGPTGSVERPIRATPVPAPIVEPTPPPPPAGNKLEGATRGLWVLAGGIVIVMGFVLFRIFTSKPQAVPTAREDENARVRRHQHRRGQGRTPASREEQRISESSRDEFMNSPMRQTGAIAPATKSGPSNPKP